jgi:hypothetical protein
MIAASMTTNTTMNRKIRYERGRARARGGLSPPDRQRAGRVHATPGRRIAELH